ncbi:MAG: hypothetical protein GXP33_04170 [Spirochaetes bacterium]|nr:hypothetical protein [Spirochaetota bacterium]
MLFYIYEDKDLLAETDSKEFAKSIMKKHKNCTIKDAKTGKEIKIG